MLDTFIYDYIQDTTASKYKNEEATLVAWAKNAAVMEYNAGS
jgi:hypothetical protein